MSSAARQELADGLKRAGFQLAVVDAAIAHRLAACPPDRADLLLRLQGELRAVAATLREIGAAS